MTTSLTNLNSHPVSARLIVEVPGQPNGIDFVTIQPRGKVTLPPGHTVDPNWAAVSANVTINTVEAVPA